MPTLTDADKKLLNFSRNLRNATDEHGAKMALCDAVGISGVHLRRLMAGTSVPTLGLAIRIAEHANLRVDDFFLPADEFARLHARRNKGRGG